VDFCRHLDLLDKDWFVACLDIGHAEMKGLNTSAVDMIFALGDRLKCLHIHDNDKHHDSHKLPYTYGIDFEPIIDALAKIGYNGDITFEADSFPPGFPTKLYPNAVKVMHDVGMYIKTEIAERKGNR
ncbi:MAG: TIM barrel protein, partial [Clostridia bacterium]|nr:TIM barrel protein [Clostridia bacterium]